MPLANLSPEAMTIIGILASTIGLLASAVVGLVIYFFAGLKSDLKGIKSELTFLIKNNARLVHKDECHLTSGKIEDKIDEIDNTQSNHGVSICLLEERQSALRAKL